jgi:hypothetical protein
MDIDIQALINDVEKELAMTKKLNESAGGKRAQFTGSLAETLALAYLQRMYPGTIIRFNHDHDNGIRAYDIEQISRLDFDRERLEPCSSPASPIPDRLWEVKAICRSSKSFLINPNAHSRFLAQRARKGRFYLFVVFASLNHSVEEENRELLCHYRIQERPAQNVEREFFRNGKVYGGQIKVPYYRIFSKRDL